MAPAALVPHHRSMALLSATFPLRFDRAIYYYPLSSFEITRRIKGGASCMVFFIKLQVTPHDRASCGKAT